MGEESGASGMPNINHLTHIQKGNKLECENGWNCWGTSLEWKISENKKWPSTLNQKADVDLVELN
jgi:hypothetical protein